jgi:hypothetical protein
MPKKPTSGEVFGVPYNFERPSVRRLFTSYWRPGKGMLVKKPFGIGYTLNLASWRSWVVLLVAGVLYWHEQTSKAPVGEGEEEEPDVIVED